MTGDSGKCLAAPQGFEPRYADPESAVLPLNEGAAIAALRGMRPYNSAAPIVGLRHQSVNRTCAAQHPQAAKMQPARPLRDNDDSQQQPIFTVSISGTPNASFGISAPCRVFQQRRPHSNRTRTTPTTKMIISVVSRYPWKPLPGCCASGR